MGGSKFWVQFVVLYKAFLPNCSLSAMPRTLQKAVTIRAKDNLLALGLATEKIPEFNFLRHAIKLSNREIIKSQKNYFLQNNFLGNGTKTRQIREFLFPSFAQPLNPISHERGVFRTLSNFAASRDPIQLHELKCTKLKYIFSVSATSIQVITSWG